MPDSSDRQGLIIADNEMPAVFGRYLLLKRLRSDAIGEEILAAWGADKGMDRLRNLRFVYRSLARESGFENAFLAEARALASLASSNVARVIEVGIEGGHLFAAREHVDGASLERLMQLADRRKAPWPWELAAHVTSEILRGLDHVHTRRDPEGRPLAIFHGDVRPANAIVSFDGEVKLTNFGSSMSAIADERTVAEIRSMRGSYLPPEAGESREATVAADLWGSALILWVLLAGRPPSSTTNVDGISWVPPSIVDRVESMPRALDAFLAQAFNPDPDFRFQSAASMREALLTIAGNYVTGHPPDDLASWVRDLAAKDREEEERFVKRALQKTMGTGEETPEDDGSLGPGSMLDGRYRLLKLLGEGGMGMVYEAEHFGIGRRVAVKVLHQRVLDDQVAVERFKREALITGGLGHPNIVGVSDSGITAEEHHYMVMDLLEGKSMADVIEKGPVPARDLIRIMAQVCDGLEAAHAAGVVHRDLKPENIFLTATGPKILDFGIAKRTGLDEETQALTRTGHICGTVEYISPEQIRGMDPDPRSDLYAVGVIIYEALTGQTPFHGRTVGETLHKAMNEKPTSPAKLTGDRTIPRELESICLKCLSRKAEKRFKSASDLGKALRALLPDDRQTTDSRMTTDAMKPVRARSFAAAAVGALFAVALLVSLVAVGLFDKRNGGDSIEKKDVDTATPVSKVESEPKTHAPESAPRASSPQPVEILQDRPEEPSLHEAPFKNAAPKSAEPAEAAASQIRTAKEIEEQAEQELDRMRLDEAERLYREAAKIDPRSANARFGLGRVAFERGQYVESTESIEKALALNPGNKRWRIFLGQVYLTMGDRENAVKQWKKVMAIDPDNAEARELLKKAGE